MSWRHPLIATLIVAGTALALGGVGCIFDEEGPDRGFPPPVVPIPSPTSPENLILALEVIYNDKVRSAADRLQAFANLLGPNFIFVFQEADQPSCGCTNWGRDDEIEAHRKIFEAQENGEIYSLELDIQFSPATDLDPPDPTRPGWKVVFASNVYLRLLTSPDDGYLVNGGQAEFLMQPLDGRWFIGVWTDLPRP